MTDTTDMTAPCAGDDCARSPVMTLHIEVTNGWCASRKSEPQLRVSVEHEVPLCALHGIEAVRQAHADDTLICWDLPADDAELLAELQAAADRRLT